MFRCRAVAQLGRALEWGSRGREFKSLRPDFFFEYPSTFPLNIESHPICYSVGGCRLDVFFPATISEKEVEAVILSTLWLRFLFQFF